jgi:hypothetical protein
LTRASSSIFRWFKAGEEHLDSRSSTHSLSTRTSLCSTNSNRCSSPPLSLLIRQALKTNSLGNDPSKLHSISSSSSSSSSSSRETFSQRTSVNGQASHETRLTKKILPSIKKVRPMPPPRIQSTSSSSAVSSASSSLSSCTGGNSRLTNGFCGIIPLLSPERRLHGRCYSFSSSSTDTDSVISHTATSPTNVDVEFPPPPPPVSSSSSTTTMRASVTDL